MLAMASFLGLFLLLALALIFAVIAIYNKLVRLRTTVKSSWSDIDVHLKRDMTLSPIL